jgi:hypothetical protein
MTSSAGKTLVKVAVVAGLTALAVTQGPKLWRYLSKKCRDGALLDAAAETVDHAVGWDKLPVPLGLLTLIGIRRTLRAKNLLDTTTLVPDVPVPPDDRHLTERTVDGTYNDLGCPYMGSAGTRFGRNVPIEKTYPEDENGILSPNPREVSLKLLTRDAFQPATTLNILAAAWLQFEVRDWLSHGTTQKENPWQVPIGPDDNWHEDTMKIRRTAADPTRSPADSGLPPTYINTETHWWDASQIYGTTRDFQKKIRSFKDGKLIFRRDQVVQLDSQTLIQQENLAGWWVGQSLMFTLFALEHNAICDHLRVAYPDWSDENLFQRARLINAALLAKIHTVEWTTAILGHPTLQLAMRTNWWGLLGEQIHKLLGRLDPSEIISGIPGAATNHFGVPYAITEEFVAVYRMHPLVPDDYELRSVATGELHRTCTLTDMAGLRTNEILDTVPMADLFYSFGIAHPGAVVLHNYPHTLQRFQRPDGVILDLAAHDILRSRELGVPRYNEFRRLLHLKPASTFEELTANPEWAAQIREVYEGDIERVDLTVGLFAEPFPEGFGFSETAFRIFVLMASRRLNSDRFFTTDFTPEVYSPEGMEWIEENSFRTVLLRHYPELAPALQGVDNAFTPWNRVG